MLKALVGTFNQEKAQGFVKTSCGTDGALHSTTADQYQ